MLRKYAQIAVLRYQFINEVFSSNVELWLVPFSNPTELYNEAPPLRASTEFVDSGVYVPTLIHLENEMFDLRLDLSFQRLEKSAIFFA